MRSGRDKMPIIEDLKVLLEEVECLKRENAWTRPEFERVLKKARRIVGARKFMLEAVLNHAQPEWLEELT